MPVSKEALLKRVIKNIQALQNDHNLPVLFSYNSGKDGIVTDGSVHLVTKFKTDHSSETSENPDSWVRAFEADQEAIDKGAKNDETYTSYQGDIPPCRLNIDLGLMSYNEIASIVTRNFFEVLLEKGWAMEKSTFWPSRLQTRFLA